MERATDGKSFIAPQTLPAAGKSQAVRVYAAQDLSPHQGNVYYCLKQVDANGKFDYSKVISVTVATIPLLVRLSPNPTRTSDFTLAVSSATASLKVVLFDAHGRTVYQREYPHTTEGIRIQANLPRGIYTVYCRTENTHWAERLVVL